MRRNEGGALATAVILAARLDVVELIRRLLASPKLFLRFVFLKFVANMSH